MKIVKIILNLILSFFLIISIIGTLATNILGNKLLNKNYVLSKIEETEFYLQISREVENGFENYIYQSGLPEDIIKDLFTEDMIKTDINSIVDYVYEGTEKSMSNTKVRENLDNKINTYLQEQDIKLNNQGKNNIKKFEDLIEKEYKNNVNVSNKLYEEIENGIVKIKNVYDKISKLPLIITAVIVVLIVIINIKDLLNVINYIGISLLSSGILAKLGVNLVFNKVNIDNILFLAESISNLLKNISKDILFTISDNANILILVGAISIIVSSIFKYIGNQPEEETKKPKVKRRLRTKKEA